MKNPALLIMSDTHRNRSALRAVLKWAKKHNTDTVFLGDGIDDVSQVTREIGFSLPITFVSGNGDAVDHVPYVKTLEFAGHTFFITHGHQFRVSEGLDVLVTAAKSAGADAALYGHTHIPFWEEIEGMLILNPGSVGAPRSSAGACFALIECPPNEWFKISYWSIRDGIMGKVIRELS